MGELIRLEGIVKSFDDTVVLNGIDLSVEENQFVTLLGPSGCGKTTTLRIIAGFEKPDSGRVFFDGKDITDMPANERPVNTVFQNYALFPHMNVGLIAIKRGSHEIIPRGNTELLAGDYLVILLKESIASSVQEELILHCNKITM